MSLLDDYAVDASSAQVGYIKALVYAPSGVGKTSLTATMPGPVMVLATEPQGLLTVKRVASELGRNDVKVLLIEDKFDKAGKQIYTAKQFLYKVLDDLDKEDTYLSVAFDSLTDAQNLFLRGMKKNRGDKPLTQQEWGILIDETRELCIRLRNLKKNVLVIALAHEVEVDDAGGKRIIYRPALSGKKLPTDLAQYFNLVGFPKKERPRGTQAATRYYVLIDGDDTVYTKTHPALDAEEETNVATWIAKIDKYAENHGEGRIPTKSVAAKAVATPADKAAALLADPEIILLFDKLKAPDAKRRITLEKYGFDRAKTIEALTARVTESEKTEAAAAAKAAAAIAAAAKPAQVDADAAAASTATPAAAG